MGTDQGVIVVAFGSKAKTEAGELIASLRKWHDWPVLAVTDGDVKGADRTVGCEDPGWGARGAKLNMDLYADWPRFLYLDADTRVQGDLSAGFRILEDGWDVAMTLSQHQEAQWLWQASDVDRALVEGEAGCTRPLSLQGGVLFAQKNERTAAFFEAWRAEWQRLGHVDQGALLRALHRSPVRLWLLGRDWNGGGLVAHRFGRARA